MDSFNKKEGTNIFLPLLLLNSNLFLSQNKSEYNFFPNNILNSNLSSLPFIGLPEIEQSGMYKTNIKDINQISDINSKDTVNNTKSVLQRKRNKTISKQGEKTDIDIGHKYSKSSLICRVKKIIFDSILNYDNHIISKMYDNKIGNGINIKQLLRTNHSQIKCSGKIFNKDLLRKTQGEIFSSDITT